MSFTGRWVAINSFKHNGSIHRIWDRGLILENNDNFIVIATKKAKVTEANGRKWFTKEPAVTIFSKKEWWNAICMLKTNGICYYCNIASPAILENSTIKYIDYDLDAKLFVDKSIRVLDKKEYEHHKASYGYDDDLDEVLQFQTKEVVQSMKDGLYPFIDEKIREYYDSFLKYLKKE